MKTILLMDNVVIYTSNVRYPEKIHMPSFILLDSQGHKGLSLRAVSSGQWVEESQPLSYQGEDFRTLGDPTNYILLLALCGHGESSLSEVRLPFLQGKGGMVLREFSALVLWQQLQLCPGRRSKQAFIGFTVRTLGADEWTPL